MTALSIIPATAAHFEQIIPIFREIMREGVSYTYRNEEMDDAAIIQYWTGEGTFGHVALIEGKVAGVYALRPIRPGRGSHIGNASYIVHADYRGRGVARALGEHSIATATALGFRGIQFHFVVSTNIPAVNLWKSLGFTIIGTTPGGFLHPVLGYVDSYIFYRSLLPATV
jgi:L-amino acid N-acyltransferase YncA